MITYGKRLAIELVMDRAIEGWLKDGAWRRWIRRAEHIAQRAIADRSW